MSKTPDTPAGPGRSRPNLSSLAKETLEDDLWDLDDDAEIPLTDAKPAAPVPRRTGDEAESPDVDPEAATAGVSPAAADGEPAGSGVEETVPDIDPVDAGTGTPAAGGLTVENPVNPLPALSSLVPSSKKERFGLATVAALVTGIGIWWLTGLFSDVATTRLGKDQPDLPVKGSYAAIDSAESYWRSPIRDGDNPDKIRPEVAMVPVLRLRLDEASSGVIRVNFRDAGGDFVGDTVNLAFSDGRFTGTGEPSADFTATDGFKELSDFNQYRVGSERWTADVLEGPSSDASGSEFRKLFSVPIATERR